MRVRAADVTPKVMERLFKSHGPVTTDLPEDARIIHIQPNADWDKPLMWRIWLSSEEFDEVPENTMAPADLTITVTELDA